MRHKPVVLLILDGVGVNTTDRETPFVAARMPMWHEMESYWPFTTLRASGVAVGLPWGEEGNSEVGHLTIGSGRVMYHHLPRIITAIHDGTFFTNDAFVRAAAYTKEKQSTLHLLGLFSTGSVHAYIDHLYALLDFAERSGVEDVCLHLFTDGRDSPPDEALFYLRHLQERMREKYPHARIVSLLGRHFAMDRDSNWDRVETAYNLLTQGKGETFTDPSAYLQHSYKESVFDEFVKPACLVDDDGKPEGRIKPGDSVIFYNFREDSEREMVEAFLSNEYKHFDRKKVNDLFFVTMTEYDSVFPAVVAFPPIDIDHPLAEIISRADMKQIHIAETEKYAHVTYFFNGGKEKPYKGEERVLIPSVQTSHFNDMPTMSITEVTKAVIGAIPEYDFIVANFANGDMVGHTGDFDATIKAFEALDRALGEIIPQVIKAGGAVIVTADHGNAEEKRYHITAEPRTKHTTNPVPCFLVTEELRLHEPRSVEEVRRKYDLVEGVLTDVAPTILELLDLPKPADMIGVSLMEKLKEGR